MPPPRQALPPSFSSQEFRDALGMFATGVTIVTARKADGGVIGLTANSFNSVSLSPPLVLWSLARAAGSLPTFSTGSHYAINILAADQKALYFAGLDKLVDDAIRRGDYPAAVADQRAILEGGREDVNSLRTLAELHAKNADPLNALIITTRALQLAKTDPDLLAKKDSYYYSVDVEKIRQVKDKVAPWFDVEYCLTKARKVADSKEPDLDTIEYGLHLAKLARVLTPKSHAAMVAEARLLLRKGERDAGVSLLEDVREQEKGSGEEEDAWYLATRLLGDLYLNELKRPDLAVLAYSSYRSYHRSGAETLFQLALAHEAAGNAPAALKCFEAVTGYKEHPRYWDANEAVRRLKGE